MFKVVKDRCIGCNICIDLCLEAAIRMTDDEVAEINPQKCASCGVCAEICTQKAIEKEIVRKKIPS